MAVHTQVAIDEFAVVHLASHGTDLLEFGFLTVHPFPQPLELLTLRHGLALTWVLLLQIPQSLLLNAERRGNGRTGEGNGQFQNGGAEETCFTYQTHNTHQQKPFLTPHYAQWRAARECDENNKEGPGKM